MRILGLLLTLAMIGALVWYLLGDVGRRRAGDAVGTQVDEAKRMVKDVEKTVGANPMDRLQEEEKEEMRRLIRERTQTR